MSRAMRCVRGVLASLPLLAGAVGAQEDVVKAVLKRAIALAPVHVEYEREASAWEKKAWNVDTVVANWAWDKKGKHREYLSLATKEGRQFFVKIYEGGVTTVLWDGLDNARPPNGSVTPGYRPHGSIEEPAAQVFFWMHTDQWDNALQNGTFKVVGERLSGGKRFPILEGKACVDPKGKLPGYDVQFEVDPEHGSCPIALRCFGHDGVKREASYSYTVERLGKTEDGLWFPSVVRFGKDSVVIFKKVTIGKELPPELFRFAFPPGTVVGDEVMEDWFRVTR